MKSSFRKGTAKVTCIQLCLLLSITPAQPAASEEREDKPFAEQHIILQVSDADPTKYTAILDIANNLIKHYEGPDLIDIEVIAFGKGVEMYFASSTILTSNDLPGSVLTSNDSPDSVLTSNVSTSNDSPGNVSTGNVNSTRIASLQKNGVRFYVCLNTIDSIQRRTGKRPVLLDGIKGVQTGVAFLLEEIQAGYIPIHP